MCLIYIFSISSSAYLLSSSVFFNDTEVHSKEYLKKVSQIWKHLHLLGPYKNCSIIVTKVTNSRSLFKTLSKIYVPLDPVHKVNVHKTSRTRPRRLLNVLCTFSVRFMSKGMKFSCEEVNGYMFHDRCLAWFSIRL